MVSGLFARTLTLHRKRAEMKRDIVLLVDADAETVSALVAIAARANFDLRFAQTSPDFFPLTRDDLADVELIVLGAASDLQSLNVLEALAGWVPNPPVILISDPDEKILRPTMFAHVVTELLEKPVSMEGLRTVIARFVHSAESHRCRCDIWGHPCADCTKRRGASPQPEVVSLAQQN
jgi:DNA-binding response OmpR family regulator